MMKRRLALCLALALLVGLLGGCGGMTLRDILGSDRGGYVDMVPFSDMEYARPDLDTAIDRQRRQTGQSRAAAHGGGCGSGAG